MTKNFPCSAPAMCALAAFLSVCWTAPARVQAQPATTGAVYGPPVPVNDDRLPGIRVTLSRSVYTIHADPKTGEPKMPKNVIASAELRNWPINAPRPTAFTWRVYLDWDFEVFPTHHAINARTFEQASPLGVNLDEQIRGGQLTVIAKAQLNGAEVCGQARALVLGENPPRKAVLKAFPPSRFGLIASKIGMAESGLRQFTNSRGALDPGGMPVVSRTNDVGMMQLNAPSGAITSADEVWDWRANLRRGLRMLAGKQRSSFLASRHAVGLHRVQENCCCIVACLNIARAFAFLPDLDAPLVPALSEKPGSGVLLSDPDPDNLKLSQWERDAIRRYNGGSEYTYAVLPDPDTLEIRSRGWQIDPTRGGIRPTSGDPNYVRHVLNARSGFTLPPPPKPKMTLHHKSRRHRRHKKR